MAIVTISRGSYSHGREIAEKVAQKLGYQAISREVLIDAARLFHVSERELLKSIHDAPTFLDRITHGKEKYLLYIQAALLEYASRDNIVYHGHAGHFLLPDESNVLKVRVIADMAQRIAYVEKEMQLSRKEAVAYIEKIDRQRSRWTRYLYNEDINDPRLYDMIINTGVMPIEAACDLIACAVRMEAYQTTPRAKKVIEDLTLAVLIKTLILDICDAEVTADNGIVRIKSHTRKIRQSGFTTPYMKLYLHEKIKNDLIDAISTAISGVPGIKEVVYDIDTPGGDHP